MHCLVEPPAQAPLAWQVVPEVQAFPSLQAAPRQSGSAQSVFPSPSLSCPSVHCVSVGWMHLPAWQVPDEHAEPLPRAGFEHAPVAGLQTSSVQSLPSEHCFACPLAHAPAAVQASPTVQASPSSQGEPAGRSA